MILYCLRQPLYVSARFMLIHMEIETNPFSRKVSTPLFLGIHFLGILLERVEVVIYGMLIT